MYWVHWAVEYFLHLDKHLQQFATDHQQGIYGLLFAIVFCETGLVVTPFLPGDSLLFAVGALAAGAGSHINLALVMVVLCAAANCGDLVNYSIGKKLGPKVFSREKSLLLNPRHLAEAQGFYDRFGRSTIIMARFVPIIRTFAPFVAGIGRMNFVRFATFSVFGGMLWVVSVSLAGYYFGRIPVVSRHFELVVLAIVGVSLIPMAIGVLRSRGKKQERPAPRGFEVTPMPEPELVGVGEES